MIVSEEFCEVLTQQEEVDFVLYDKDHMSDAGVVIVGVLLRKTYGHGSFRLIGVNMILSFAFKSVI